MITLDDEDFKIITHALFLLQSKNVIKDHKSIRAALTLRKIYKAWEEIETLNNNRN